MEKRKSKMKELHVNRGPSKDRSNLRLHHEVQINGNQAGHQRQICPPPAIIWPGQQTEVESIYLTQNELARFVKPLVEQKTTNL